MVIKMVKKEQLLAISGLKLAGKIERLNDSQVREYVQHLNAFAEKLPAHQERLKSAIDIKNYDSLATRLDAVHDMLIKIYADDIAAECLGIIESLKNKEHEKTEERIANVLSSISMLSIDIQLLDRQDEEEKANLANLAVMNTELNKTGGEVREEKPKEEEPETDKNSILAVDDSAFLLHTLKSFLTGTPYKVTCVTSGAAALSFLSSHRPGLFILDVEMPGMNGYELAKKIREAKQSAPIIFLTGSATKESVLKALDAGAADFIVKPTDKVHLLNRIAKYMQ